MVTDRDAAIATLLRLTPSNAVRRGQHYAAAGHVIALAWEGDEVHAEVEGTDV